MPYWWTHLDGSTSDCPASIRVEVANRTSHLPVFIAYEMRWICSQVNRTFITRSQDVRETTFVQNDSSPVGREQDRWFSHSALALEFSRYGVIGIQYNGNILQVSWFSQFRLSMMTPKRQFSVEQVPRKNEQLSNHRRIFTSMAIRTVLTQTAVPATYRGLLNRQLTSYSGAKGTTLKDVASALRFVSTHVEAL